jgi:hypothetical protein
MGYKARLLEAMGTSVNPRSDSLSRNAPALKHQTMADRQATRAEILEAPADVCAVT